MTHWIIILPICIVNNADVDLIEKEDRWSMIYIDFEKSYPYSYIFILFDSATKPATFWGLKEWTIMSNFRRNMVGVCFSHIFR